MKNIEVIGGGTVYHVRNHLPLSVPAYGTTARILATYCQLFQDELDTHLHLTKMATQGQSELETNEDISNLVDRLIANPDTKIIFFNPALVDYEGSIYRSGNVGYEWSDCIPTSSGKYEPRLQTSKGEQEMLLSPAPKVLSKIRKERKDIFLVAESCL